MFIKKKILKLLRVIKQFGFDPVIFFKSIYNLPFYLKSYFLFRKNFKGKIIFYPCLNDRKEEAGSTKSEYFWQDLLVANSIYADSPDKHVDIGSRLDGFIAHVATFREIEVFDVRPLSPNIPNVLFKHANLTKKPFSFDFDENSYCDSLSCLHALEHFGLGRYGDPINPDGYNVGIENMARFLKPKGKFYLSTPIGYERVEFNANWIFDPRKIVKIASNNNLRLVKLTIFNQEYGVRELDINEKILDELAQQEYNLGIFTFIKN